MNSFLNLQIADFRFQIGSHQNLPIEQLPAEYQAFLSSELAVGPGGIIHVEISDGDPELPEPAFRVFDSGSAWQLYRRDGNDIIVMKPPDHQRPIWTAALDLPHNRISICVNRDALTQTNEGTMTNPFQYPLDQIVLMYAMARSNGFIIHSAGALKDGKMTIFAGRSGAGKSTLSGILGNHSDWTIISDDRMILRKINGQWIAFGTPWPGDYGAAENISAPIESIMILDQASRSQITKMDAGNARNQLSPVLSIPWYDRDFLPDSLDAFAALITENPVFRFQFTRDDSILDTLHKLIVSNQT